MFAFRSPLPVKTVKINISFWTWIALMCSIIGNLVIFQLDSSPVLNRFVTWLSWIRVFSKSLRSLWSVCEASSQSCRGQRWILHPSFRSCSLPLIHASACITNRHTDKHVALHSVDVCVYRPDWAVYMIFLFYLIWKCISFRDLM